MPALIMSRLCILTPLGFEIVGRDRKGGAGGRQDLYPGGEKSCCNAANTVIPKPAKSL
jgi:hypothetical protein